MYAYEKSFLCEKNLHIFEVFQKGATYVCIRFELTLGSHSSNFAYKSLVNTFFVCMWHDSVTLCTYMHVCLGAAGPGVFFNLAQQAIMCPTKAPVALVRHK